MGDLPRDPNFAMEPRDSLGVERQRIWQELQGHRLVELDIVGLLDLAHSAASQQGDDPVAIDEKRPGNEATVI
jgi:hypothetical protein